MHCMLIGMICQFFFFNLCVTHVFSRETFGEEVVLIKTNVS